MRKFRVIFPLLVLALGWAAPVPAAKIQFRFDTWAGPPMRVFVTRPAGLAADRPVVFVLHGVNRNADEYRDQWHELAKEHDFLLVVPEFSHRGFPGAEAYNLGNVFDNGGKPVADARWSYSAIEPIFDEVRRRFSLSTPRYSLYGHSAGSQFVHRFVFHVPDARLARAVSANAGWYMMPDFEADYPYGLRGSAVTREKLASALGMPMTILLGELDTDTDDPNLRRAPEAMAQGKHRFARGQAYFGAVKSYAESNGIPFNWSLSTVPGADHDNRLMAPAAIPFLVPVRENGQGG